MVTNFCVGVCLSIIQNEEDAGLGTGGNLARGFTVLSRDFERSLLSICFKVFGRGWTREAQAERERDRKVNEPVHWNQNAHVGKHGVKAAELLMSASLDGFRMGKTCYR